MYKFSFKIRHDCYETRFAMRFPKYHITVIDIQAVNPKQKQYLYYIKGNDKKFDSIISYLKSSKGYKLVKEIERSKDTLILLVVLYQKGYIQNIIQKYNGFLIDLHTCYEGWEYWHVGVINRESIDKMITEFKKIGELKVLYIGQADFQNTLLSKQQKKIFTYAYTQGYYEKPRKTTIAKISKALNLNHATVGEHLIKAENKIVNMIARKI